MYQFIEPFGYNISGKTLGEAWVSLVTAVTRHGEESFDEGRRRLALQTVRLRIASPSLPDILLDRYANKKNISAVVKLTLEEKEMVDIDVNPSFSAGSKSYHTRLVEGKMIEFVVERLGLIPESKKAVMVFPTYDDYAAVLTSPKDDYLPCIVSIQYRLHKSGDGYCLDTIFYARSLDCYQKGAGNLVAMLLLAEQVAERLSQKLGHVVRIGILDGLIADTHIYEETFKECERMISRIEREKTVA